MAAQWYKYAQGFLLVYSITDRVSYENLLLLHQDILRVKDRPSVPVIVVSNKVSGVPASKPLTIDPFLPPTCKKGIRDRALISSVTWRHSGWWAKSKAETLHARSVRHS